METDSHVHLDTGGKNLKEAHAIGAERLFPKKGIPDKSFFHLELAEHAARNHEPILRHLAYEFPEQGYEREQSMYMLGSRYLVVPMLEKGRKSRTVTLPKGKWRESDGTLYIGGAPVELEFPLEKVYVFEKMA